MTRKFGLLMAGIFCTVLSGQALSAPPWASLSLATLLMQNGEKGEKPAEKKTKEIKVVKVSDEAKETLLPIAEAFVRSQQSANAVLENIKSPITARLKTIMEAVEPSKREELAKGNELFMKSELPTVIVGQTGLYGEVMQLASNMMSNIHQVLIADGYQFDTRMPPQIMIGENSLLLAVVEADWDEALIKKFTKLRQEYGALSEKPNPDTETGVKLAALKALIIETQKKIKPSNLRVATIIKIDMILNTPKAGEGAGATAAKSPADEDSEEEGEEPKLVKDIKVVELDKADFQDILKVQK